MLVSVGGSVASGKTTLARNLAEKLGVPHISAGSVLREMAQERGQTLLEFSAYAESHPEVDREIDDRQKTAAKDAGSCVVDGRLSVFFLKPDLAIWLIAPPAVRAQRLISRGEKLPSLSAALDAMEARERSEHIRYMKFYGIDLSDLSVYDIIINTGRVGIPAMTQISLAAAQAVAAKKK